jgi:hypothetical protein
MYRYLSSKFIAVDLCFRLKRRQVSSEEKDPDWNEGGAYYVEQKLFQPFAKSLPDQKEVGLFLKKMYLAISTNNDFIDKLMLEFGGY